ncbi:GGDEF domain-containing phosphodiesterase [Aliiglaciecola litoralis]|uniref:Uncharacterized protein n=1 Tax=Aliiglaciecola litoralis TaxID=582857 RepID=A0ABP3WR20_9ALTE
MSEKPPRDIVTKVTIAGVLFLIFGLMISPVNASLNSIAEPFTDKLADKLIKANDSLALIQTEAPLPSQLNIQLAILSNSQRTNNNWQAHLATSFATLLLKRAFPYQLVPRLTITLPATIVSKPAQIQQIELHTQTGALRIHGLIFALALLIIIVTSIGLTLLFVNRGSKQLNSSMWQLLEHSRNPIIILDKENRSTYHNRAAQQLLASLNIEQTNTKSLLPNNLQRMQSVLLDNSKPYLVFEYALGNKLVECELYWLNKSANWYLYLQDITVRKNTELKVQFQAYHHPQTSLENQYRFNEVVAQWVKLGEPFTHGQIEIRSFSRLLADNAFNKSQQVIMELAAVLDKVCHDMPDNIRLFHIGDKNFAVLIPKTECEETVADLVTSINKAIKFTQFTDQHHVELDFGFASFPKDGDNLEAIKRNTRIALDTSASLAHSDYLIFDDQLGETIARQNTLHIAMRKALEAQHFQLYFQPQLSLLKNNIIGAEVLLRWQLDGQWIQPAELIPLAERSGFILQLGDWILAQACIKAQHLVKLGYTELVTAVNISPKQFTAPNFVDKVVAALSDSGLPAHNLELEITEGVLFNNDYGTLDSLQKLRKMGVKLAIDDFGTGYSSLSYLKDFPIDKIKIDQSFVRNMHTDPADQSIVRTIVNLGKNLGITLIAEGVENQSQLDSLKSIGCDEIQGYWYSKPLEEDFFVDFLHQKQPLP